MHALASAHQRQWTKRVHDDSSLAKYGISSIQPVPSLRTHSSSQIPPEALQFAPPLAAYTAEQCGADEMFLEYNSTSQSAALRGVKDIALFLPQTLKKLQRLQQIREMGYFTLRPVGFPKLMAEVDSEQLAEEEERRSGHSENLTAMEAGEHNTHHTLTSTANVDNSRDSSDIGGPSSSLELHSAALAAGMDRDLDDNLVDADLNDLSLQTEDADSDTPDAFMAEEVEYQNDHSLAPGSTVGSGSFIIQDSGTAGSGPAWISPLVTTSSRVVSTSSARPQDESDVDMTLD